MGVGYTIGVGAVQRRIGWIQEDSPPWPEMA